MPKLIYFAIASLDGYVADTDGKFDWAVPDADVHAFVNDLHRSVGTYLYGRRMYEVMRYWDTASTGDDVSPAERDFTGIWKAADKIIFSKSLTTVSISKARIERELDPEAIRRLKAESSRDISVGGPDLAGQMFKAGLVDEIQLFLNPIIIGGGKLALPDDVRVRLELLKEHRFRNGVVYVHYRTVPSA